MSRLAVGVAVLVVVIVWGAPAHAQSAPARKAATIAVKIDSTPQQAEIYLDDKKAGLVGYTPWEGRLAPGNYALILELPGYQTVTRAVTVDARNHDFAVALVKGAPPPTPPPLPAVKKGSLLVDADVPAATVLVDGKKLADPTPVVADALDEGTHTVEVTKEAGQTWRQTVTVKPGARTKVVAELRALAGGTVRVLTNVPDAEVFVDGTSRGKAPLDVPGLAVGNHIVQARAPGHADKEQAVQLAGGQLQVIKLDLLPGVSGPSGTLRVTTAAPGATVFVDGTSVGVTPWESGVAAGDHLVVVEKDGFGRFERRVTVGQGGALDVAAELKPVGSLRFLSSPDGASVVLDGNVIGKTPLVKTDVPAGDHVIAFRADGFHEFQQPVTVQGGQMAVLNGTLRSSNEPAPNEDASVRQGLSSYGAALVPPGHVTLDASLGYPYWLEFRAATGVPQIRAFPVDVAVGFRSLLDTWEFLFTGRVRLAHQEPFALAAFATIGGGAGADGRNQFTFQTGVIGSILFSKVATVSARLYLDAWSDRLCSTDDTGKPQGADVCTGKASAADVARAEAIHGTDLFARDTGVRIYTSAVAEIAVSPVVNFFVVFEGTPFQDQRAGFTGLFTPTLVSDSDPIYNVRAGLTFKF